MIKFYCRECGKEMWQLINFASIKHLTIGEVKRRLICSDCIEKRMGKDIDSVNLLDTGD